MHMIWYCLKRACKNIECTGAAKRDVPLRKSLLEIMIFLKVSPSLQKKELCAHIKFYQHYVPHKRAHQISRTFFYIFGFSMAKYLLQQLAPKYELMHKFF